MMILPDEEYDPGLFCRRERRRRKLTQFDLQIATGISDTAIRKLEQGVIPVDEVQTDRILYHFGCKLENGRVRELRPGEGPELARLPEEDTNAALFCRRERQRRGLSQAGLAVLAGVAPEIICRIEASEDWPEDEALQCVLRVLTGGRRKKTRRRRPSKRRMKIKTVPPQDGNGFLGTGWEYQEEKWRQRHRFRALQRIREIRGGRSNSYQEGRVNDILGEYHESSQ